MASTNKKKYQIAVTQFPKHEHSLDFIRGIPYAAKDNVMFCTARKITLEEYKIFDPSAESAPNGILIIQDMNHNDIVITSDQIQTFADTPLYMHEDNTYMRLIPSVIIENTMFGEKSCAMLAYNLNEEKTYVFKISDVDIWIAG